MKNNEIVSSKIEPYSDTGSGVRTNLIYGDQALADALGASLSKIRTWRSGRIIPYIKTGHKSVIYNLHKVLAALGALEVEPVTKKGAR
jgi:hypothetical protein